MNRSPLSNSSNTGYINPNYGKFITRRFDQETEVGDVEPRLYELFEKSFPILIDVEIHPVTDNGQQSYNVGRNVENIGSKQQ